MIDTASLTAATLFSGIGAPEVAMPEWRWLWHAEIEKFPAAVMAQRHAGSVNLGDVTANDFTERALAIGRPDVLVFGSPCQSFSVAGRRLGMDDPRGNLALVALGIVARLEPAWFVFENVPGLLSASEGRDFGLFLRTVDELGYHLCWRHLDAQYAGVAQRRVRLFAVGHPRDWRGPAAVLLEPESLCGHPPARGEEGQDVAAGTLRSTDGGLDVDHASAGHLVQAFGGNNTAGPIAAAAAVNAKGGSGRMDFESETLITHALRADGFDASEDGTGRGTPLVPVVASTLKSNHGGGGFGSDPSETFVPVAFTMKDYGADAGELSPTLRSGGHDNSHANGGVMPAVAFHENQRAEVTLNNTAGSLKVSGGKPGQGYPAVFLPTAVQEAQTGVREYDSAGALRANGPGHDPVGTRIRDLSGVRRLMPVECERLQGFPDGYTAITYRGKPASDGPRYKAIGNSMAVPVVRWILKRIDWLERYERQQKTGAA